MIEQAAQVNIQDPSFSTERVQVEFRLIGDGPGGQDHATCATFECIIAASARSNRPGGNRTSEVNKRLLPVGYLIDQEIYTCSFQVGFLGDEQVKKKASK